MRYILGINKKVQEAKNELDIAHKHVKESIEYASLIKYQNSQERNDDVTVVGLKI